MMPLIGWIVGKVDFSQLAFSLPALTGGDHTPVKYGIFLTVLVNFLIVAFAIFFFVVKPINKMKKPAPAAGPSDVDLLTEIRDLLKKK